MDFYLIFRIVMQKKVWKLKYINLHHLCLRIGCYVKYHMNLLSANSSHYMYFLIISLYKIWFFGICMKFSGFRLKKKFRKFWRLYRPLSSERVMHNYWLHATRSEDSILRGQKPGLTNRYNQNKSRKNMPHYSEKVQCKNVALKTCA